MPKTLKTDRLGITIEKHPYDRGYWARFNGQPRPSAWRERQGWDQCDREIRPFRLRRGEDS